MIAIDRFRTGTGDGHHRAIPIRTSPGLVLKDFALTEMALDGAFLRHESENPFAMSTKNHTNDRTSVRNMTKIERTD